MRRVVRITGLVVCVLVATLVIAEWLVRSWNPVPPIQVVRSGKGVNLFSLNGEPVWEFLPDDGGRACIVERPESPVVVLVGSSILGGSDLHRPETVGPRLQRLLDDSRPRVDACVVNLSQTGFTYGAKRAVLDEFLRGHRADVVFWEDWENEPWAYRMLGKSAYRFEMLRVGDDGYPDTFPLPGWLNAWLFRNSRLYEHASLVWAPARDVTKADVDHWVAFARDVLPTVAGSVRAAGGQVVHILAPYLSRGFPETAAEPPGFYRHVLEMGDRIGVPVLRLEVELRDLDVSEVRMDTCCHYNGKGHSALASILLPRVVQALGGPGRSDPVPGDGS